MRDAIQRALGKSTPATAKPPLPSSLGLDTSDKPKPRLPWQDPDNPLVQAAARGNALPNDQAETLGPDPGAFMPAARQAADLVLGPLFGLPEKVGLVPAGTRAQMKTDLEDERQRALEHGHTVAQTAGLAAGLVGGAALPTSIGRAATAGSKLGPMGARALGAGAGAAEGALQAWADTDSSMPAPPPLPPDPSMQQRLQDVAARHPVALGAVLGGAGGAVGAGPVIRENARIAAMRARVDDFLKQLSAPPPQRAAAQMWDGYKQAVAAVDAEIQAAVQQASANGVEVPPQAIEQLRAAKLDPIITQWHQQAATTAALSPEPGVHALADATEQLSPFTPPPLLPDADLLALRDASLKIGSPTERTDLGLTVAFKDKVGRVYRGAKGESHADLYERYPDIDLADDGDGFADTAGAYVTRDEASAQLQGLVPPRALHADVLDAAEMQAVPPFSSLIRATDPKRSVRQVLTDTANRFIEEFSDKKDPVIRTLRDAGLGERANEIELWISQSRGAARVAANTIWKGVRHWDATSGNTTRAYDSLYSITGELGPVGWRDINDFLAAENHMELLGRKATADTEYASALIARRAEIEARRQALIGARGDNRAATSQGRKDLAQQLRATRNEAKAGGEAGVRYANAKRSARMGREGELNTDLDLALNAVGRQSRAQDMQAATPGVPDVLGMLTGTTKGVERAATERYHKLPPLVQRPPDSTLKIDPRGTAWARAKLAELQQRYGADPDTGGIAQLGETARRIREWSWAAVVEQLDQVGYFTPEGKAALAAKRQQFAPFARLADEVVEDLGLTTGTHAKPVSRISGGLSPDKPIAEPLESFVAQAQRIQLWVERQRVFNILGDAAEAFPAELGDKIKRLPPNSNKGFQVFRDGVRHVYDAPDDILRALGHADASQAGWLMQAAVLATRSLRAGVTLSPDFAARNFVRDLSSAKIYGAEFNYRPFSGFLQGLWAQTPFASPELRNMVFKWESAGGALGDIISIERPQATVSAKAAAGLIDLPLIGRPVKVGKFVAKSVNEWKAERGLGRIVYPFLRPFEGAASAVENAPRIGAFMRAESKGASDLKASNFSRNITLDFGRSGKLAQRWNSLEAFSNASLQDVARFSKALRDDPAGTTIKALTYITLPALATYALNRDNPDYQSRQEWEKASFYHLFQREDKSWVMWPRPLGMLNLMYGYGIERMLEAMRGKYDEPITELLATAFNETPARYLPLQPDTDPNSMARGSYEWMPTFMQPAVEASSGEEGWSEHRRSPIVPRALIEKLPADRYTDNSSQLSRSLGEATGMAPLKIDHLIRNYGGTLAVQGLALAERAGNASELPELPMTANDIPVVGAFVSGNPYGFSTQPAQDFYAMEEAAREASNSLEAASEKLNTNPDKYYRIIRNNPEALIADELASVKSDLAELRKTRNEYRTVPGLAPELRAERLLQTDMLISQTLTATMHWVANWRQGYLKAANKWSDKRKSTNVEDRRYVAPGS